MGAAVPARFGVSFDGDEPPDLLRSIVRVAERTGPINFWIASHLFQREPIARAAMILAASPTAGVVLMAMSPYTVHPVHATMAAATLDECFPGRVQLCFGAGAPRDLEAVALTAEAPLATLRESIEISRTLLAGDTIAFEGRRFRISGRRLATGARHVPIKLAASGPRMLELAGEISDGVALSAAASPAFIRWSLEHVRRGEERSGRKIEKTALVLCATDRNERAAHDRIRRILAFILRGEHHARNLALAGAKLDQMALAHAFAREDWDTVETLANDDIVRRHAASGTPSQVAAALATYQNAGLDEIVIAGVRDSDQMARVLAAASRSFQPI
jgi:5,10-methylenetetrahydromethanopterin reductase